MGKIEDKDIDLHIDRETLLQEYIPKAQYEQRLKADIEAILDEISKEIDELYTPQLSPEGMNGFYWAKDEFKSIVDEKIYALMAK